MKKLLIVLLCIFSTQIFSQTITKDLKKEKIGSLKCSYIMKLKVGSSDTSLYVYCGFQNQKYSTIVDIGSIMITTMEKKDNIVSDLKECVKYMDDKSISFSIGQFDLFDFSKNLYINDNRKYTTLSKKNVLKWIEWLESIKKVDF